MSAWKNVRAHPDAVPARGRVVLCPLVIAIACAGCYLSHERSEPPELCGAIPPARQAPAASMLVLADDDAWSSLYELAPDAAPRQLFLPGAVPGANSVTPSPDGRWAIVHSLAGPSPLYLVDVVRGTTVDLFAAHPELREPCGPRETAGELWLPGAYAMFRADGRALVIGCRWWDERDRLTDLRAAVVPLLGGVAEPGPPCSAAWFLDASGCDLVRVRAECPVEGRDWWASERSSWTLQRPDGGEDPLEIAAREAPLAISSSGVLLQRDGERGPLALRLLPLDGGPALELAIPDGVSWVDAAPDASAAAMHRAGGVDLLRLSPPGAAPVPLVRDCPAVTFLQHGSGWTSDASRYVALCASDGGTEARIVDTASGVVIASVPLDVTGPTFVQWSADDARLSIMAGTLARRVALVDARGERLALHPFLDELVEARRVRDVAFRVTRAPR